jgi:hypothetical protein
MDLIIKKYTENPDSDILYRIKPSGKGFGGWRSFRKAVENSNGRFPFPWDMVATPGIERVEWKLVDAEQIRKRETKL